MYNMYFSNYQFEIVLNSNINWPPRTVRYSVDDNVAEIKTSFLVGAFTILSIISHRLAFTTLVFKFGGMRFAYAILLWGCPGFHGDSQ